MPANPIQKLREIDRIIQNNEIPVEEAASMLAGFRDSQPDNAINALDCHLIQTQRLQRRSFAQLEELNKEQHKTILELTREPLHTADFIKLMPPDDGPGTRAQSQRAKILSRNRVLVVGVHPDLDLSIVQPGDEVLLNRDETIVALGDRPAQPGGAMAVMERRLADGRILVKAREETMVMQCLGGAMAAMPGDLVRVSLESHHAFERIEQEQKPVNLVTDLPAVGRQQLAGLDATYERLRLAMSAFLMDRDKAERYGLKGRNSILLVGPSGTGKTLMVKVAANELSAQHGVSCRFVVVKPGAWGSMWYSQTEANIRREFEAINRLADEGGAIVIVYLDEVESISRHRGTGTGHADDKATAALLAELDGFRERSNVVIVSACNRKDLVDPAFLERISGVELQVPRPTASAAREIFSVHLPQVVPFSPNGASAPETRREIIDVAVSRLYAPNGTASIASIKFSDGKQRVVTAREMVSGRLISQICRNACEAAFGHDVLHNQPGVTVRDMEQSVEDAIERLRTTLTRANAHCYLPDLPQETQVIAVDPIRPAAKRPGYYLKNES